MNKILFNCETITPMFLAGADGKTPEIRPPSIKGALRFWWRAINGQLSLDKLKEQEAKIFGGSGENEGKSRFSIIVKNIKGTKISTKFPEHNINVTLKGKTFQINILDYLAYGTQEYRKGQGQVFIREYYDVKTSFDIEINYNNNLNINFNELFGLISLVGGLGARSRNGFGRFIISNLSFDLETFKNRFKEVEKANYTAFSNNTKLFKLSNNYNDWHSCLAELGKIYKSSRESLESRHKFEKRQYIASPILEHKKQVSLLERHAKQYFFIVKKNKDKNFSGYILFLPYNYLSNYENPPRSLTTLQDNYNNATQLLNNNLSSKMEEITNE